MFQNNLHYTVGIYNESLEGTLSTSNQGLLIQTLAWAAKNNIPFQDVILSLTKHGIPKYILFLFPRSRKWEKCLSATYHDLIKGIPLYKTLRKRFAYFLPEYFLQAVERAEKQGHLKVTLSVFAKRLNLFCETKVFYKRATIFPFFEFMLIGGMFVGISNAIIWICDNLLYGGTTPDIIFVFRGIHIAWEVFEIIISMMGFWYLLGRLFPVLRIFILMLLGEIFIFIPPFRKQIRNIAFLDLSSSMASYLDAGEDVLNAAKFSKNACNHFWLRRKLNRFIHKVEKGENWLDAWNSMNLRQNLSECIIRNAAAKEDIAAGFDTISDWLYHKQLRTVKNNAVWLNLLFVAINAILVFLIAFYMFKTLIRIVNSI